MPELSEIVAFCDTAVNRLEVTDFPGAANGLQCQNNGTVSKVAAAVDAGLIPFEKTAAAGVDFLIVHHGLFWSPMESITGPCYQKLKALFENNIALYSSHLPLDCHQSLGNNISIANQLGLSVQDWILPYEGVDMMPLTTLEADRTELEKRLNTLFSKGFTGLCFGPETPQRIGICSGSGASALPELASYGIDTFITGELKQQHFNFAQEHNLNIYLCGHYATEVFGVQNLAQAVAEKFGLEHTFIETECPL
tara:strand:+ start:27738 stop:28493 length:756 start_codon:yes stop_codon:yes gene_type:complete